MDHSTIMLIIAGTLLVVLILSAIFHIDEFFGVPIVTSILFGLMTGFLTEASFQIPLISTIVGIVLGTLFFKLYRTVRSGISSSDMNTYYDDIGD